MPGEDKKTAGFEENPNNLKINETDASPETKKEEPSGQSQKETFSKSKSGFLKSFLPALIEAFRIGAKTFKSQLKGVSESGYDGKNGLGDEQKQEGLLLQKSEEKKEELPQASKASSEPASQKQANFDSSSNEAKKIIDAKDTKKENKNKDENKDKKTNNSIFIFNIQNFLIAFLFILLWVISIGGGLYLGGVFDSDGASAKSAKSAKSVKPVKPAKPDKVEAKAKKEPVKGGGFDFTKEFVALFAKNKKGGTTPQEQLEVLKIKYTEENFVKQAGLGNMEAVKLFILSGMTLDSHRIIDGHTPLIAAASFNRLDIAKFLLDHGADINAIDSEGQTALMKAVKYNRPQLVALLLEKKADYNIVDIRGNSGLSLAKEYYRDDSITKIFSDSGIDISSVPKRMDLNLLLTSPEYKRYAEISVYDFQ